MGNSASQHSVDENIDKANKKVKSSLNKGKEVADETTRKAKSMVKDGQKKLDSVDIDKANRKVKSSLDSAAAKVKTVAKEGERDTESFLTTVNHKVDDGIDTIKSEAVAIKDKVMNSSEKFKKSVDIPQMSAEDEQILTDCSREVWLKRSLPMSGGGVAIGYLIQGKKKRLWPVVLLAAAGFAAGQLYFGMECGRRVADSGSNSEFAMDLRRSFQKVDEGMDKLRKKK